MIDIPFISIVSALHLDGKVLTDAFVNALSIYLNKEDGGVISGDIALQDSSLCIANGCYVQTSGDAGICNYSAGNGFI